MDFATVPPPSSSSSRPPADGWWVGELHRRLGRRRRLSGGGASPPDRAELRPDRPPGRSARRPRGLLALAGAMLATPYLLVHSLRRRLAERRRPTGGSLPTARASAQTRRPTKRSGVAALAEPTTAKRTR